MGGSYTSTTPSTSPPPYYPSPPTYSPSLSPPLLSYHRRWHVPSHCYGLELQHPPTCPYTVLIVYVGVCMSTCACGVCVESLEVCVSTCRACVQQCMLMCKRVALVTSGNRHALHALYMHCDYTRTCTRTYISTRDCTCISTYLSTRK